MAIIYDNDKESIIKRNLDNLAEVGLSTSVGSIVRLFTSIICSEFENAYSLIDEYMLRVFLSTSYDKYLDSIGFLLNCDRKPNESDDDYRDRISKQILIVASSNETAIKYAVLQVEGVSYVQLKNFTYGPGSFSVVIVPENPSSETDYSELNYKVYEALSDVVAYGTKYTVQTVNYDFVSMTIIPLIEEGLDDITISDIKNNILISIQKYLSNLSIGEELIIDQLTKVIMNTDEHIIDYSCAKFTINGEEVQLVNQETSWCSKFETENIKII